MKKTLRIVCCIALSLTIAACMRKPTASNVDPYERYNRAMFAFNMSLDHLLFRPVAKVYNAIVPPPLKKGVSNFFFNVGMTKTIANDILQGKMKWAVMDTLRFVLNGVLGIGGLFDVATRAGIPKHYEDFGMTLAQWSGNKREPYFILPILGPNTTRSALGLAVDAFTVPWVYMRPRSITYGMFAANFVSTRASLLDVDPLVDEAFDPYVFTRNAYLQIRNSMNDNNKRYSEYRDEQAPNIGAVGVYGLKSWGGNQEDMSIPTLPPGALESDGQIKPPSIHPPLKTNGNNHSHKKPAPKPPLQ